MNTEILSILRQYDLDEWVEIQNDDIDTELIIEQLEDMLEEEVSYSDFEWNARIANCIRDLEGIEK